MINYFTDDFLRDYNYPRFYYYYIADPQQFPALVFRKNKPVLRYSNSFQLIKAKFFNNFF